MLNNWFLLTLADIMSPLRKASLRATYLIVVIDELQGESGVGQLHGLQQGSIGRLARLQRSLTPVSN